MDPQTLQLAAHLDDSMPGNDQYQHVWNGFLRVMNVFQFLPSTGFFCKSGLDNNIYDDMEGPGS